jgi:hypothetical protein
VKDLSGYSLDLRVLVNRGDSEAIFTLTAAVADDTTDPAGSGKADIASVIGDEDDTKDLTAGAYFWVLWDATEGNEKPLASGPFELVEAGYIA